MTAVLTHQPDLLYPLIGRCAGCANQHCSHPKLKASNPMGSCSEWTDGNPTADPYEVTITPNAYLVDDKDIKTCCTLACRRGLPRKRNNRIPF